MPFEAQPEQPPPHEQEDLPCFLLRTMFTTIAATIATSTALIIIVASI